MFADHLEKWKCIKAMHAFASIVCGFPTHPPEGYEIKITLGKCVSSMTGTANRHIYEKNMGKTGHFKSHSFPVLRVRITNEISNNPSHTVMKEIIALLFCKIFFDMQQ